MDTGGYDSSGYSDNQSDTSFNRQDFGGLGSEM